jgi:hypothetical protein
MTKRSVVMISAFKPRSIDETTHLCTTILAYLTLGRHSVSTSVRSNGRKMLAPHISRNSLVYR